MLSQCPVDEAGCSAGQVIIATAVSSTSLVVTRILSVLHCGSSCVHCPSTYSVDQHSLYCTLQYSSRPVYAYKKVFRFCISGNQVQKKSGYYSLSSNKSLVTLLTVRFTAVTPKHKQQFSDHFSRITWVSQWSPKVSKKTFSNCRKRIFACQILLLMLI